MPRSTSRRNMAGLVIFLIAVASIPAYSQSVEVEVDAAQKRLEAARASHLQIISPKNFEKAAKAFEQADASLAKGGKIDDIRRKLAEGDRALDTAEGLRELGVLTLRDALDARSDALASNAPEFAPKIWEDAEKSIIEAGRKIEDGKQNDAQKSASKSVQLYREAELQSIRADVLGTAKNERANALVEKAEERAPATLARADELMGEAEKVIKGDRYQRAKARKFAEQATEQYKHAALIARNSLALDKDRKQGPEQLMLDYETQVARIAEALRYEPTFSEGIEEVAQQMIAAIKSIHEDRASLEQQLDEAQAQIESMDTRLASLTERDAQLSMREKRERKWREVERTFTKGEAEVLLGGDQIIVRLYGISFKSGSSEIRPDNFSLLTKVQRVLREFPTSAVVIEGHTDSQGNDDYNLALSQRRADAVRDYLLANMDIEASMISALGFGESRPISSNETENGRAKNRRIDVLVDIPSLAGQ